MSETFLLSLPAVRPEGFDRDGQQHRLWWILNLQFSGKVEALHHEISVNDTMCLEVIELVELSLDVIERLSERGVLRYMQDAAAAMLSRFTAQLVSVCRPWSLRKDADMTRSTPDSPSR